MKTPRLAVLALLALAACQSKADRTGLASRGFYAPDFEMVWEKGQEEMMAAGFVPDLENSGRETRTIVSRWSLSMMPFANKGYREQATLTFQPVEGQTNRWTVEANVLREVNSNITQPSNPVVAKWETGTRVPEKERMLVARIESVFRTHDVSPEFRARYGMPAAPEGGIDDRRPPAPTTDATRPR
jgi:hypothetical protein